VSAIISNENTNLSQLLIVLRRRWRLLLLCPVLVAAAAVGFSELQTREYTASSSLLFRDTQFDQELFGTNFTPSALDPTQEQATNFGLVSLPTVAARAAAALHLSPALVSSETSIVGVGQANIATVSVTDPDPVRAAQIANTYAQQYVLFRQQADRAKIAGAQALVQHDLLSLPPAQRYSSVGQSLQSRAAQLGVLAALQTGNAEVVEPAGVPTSPSSPQTKRNGLLGLLLGLLLGTGVVFTAERLDQRVHDASEVEDVYGVPLLGTVPESESYALAGTQPLPAAEGEAFALLRARLRYFNVDRDVRTLMASSAIPGEGKTTVALNLAMADAVAGDAKVVLLEADLRRPVLAQRLGLPGGPGLAEILSRNATLDSALRTVVVPQLIDANGTSPPRISVITAGATPPNPAELLESRAMVDLLSTLSERFDLVIIDTPPTSVVSDAIPLMRLVSGVVVVSRIDTTTRDAARHLRQQLTNLNAPTLGVIANAQPARGSDYGQGYYYYHEYIATRDAAAAPQDAEPEAVEAAAAENAAK
jgi:polysaccharide biosynthesis transport protein